MIGNKIYFREEIGFENGLGGGEFEGEREMSRVMAHGYLAWETGWLQVTFTELGKNKFWRWGLRSEYPSRTYLFEMTLRYQSGDGYPTPHKTSPKEASAHLEV